MDVGWEKWSLVNFLANLFEKIVQLTFKKFHQVANYLGLGRPTVKNGEWI